MPRRRPRRSSAATTGSDVKTQLKADQSPVTEADVRAEEAIRAILSERFPRTGSTARRRARSAATASIWLVDPIDGTKSFVRECPFFSTQIALMRGGELVLGVSSAPAYGELAWAEQGAGAFLNGRPDQGRAAIAELQQAIVSTGNLKTLAAIRQWGRFGELIQRVSRIRGYGDFVHYHLLARGSLDVVIESDVNILDIAALTVIVREAGGMFTDLAGTAPSDLRRLRCSLRPTARCTQPFSKRSRAERILAGRPRRFRSSA